jgi:hypothetical protein
MTDDDADRALLDLAEEMVDLRSLECGGPDDAHYCGFGCPHWDAAVSGAIDDLEAVRG